MAMTATISPFTNISACTVSDIRSPKVTIVHPARLRLSRSNGAAAITSCGVVKCRAQVDGGGLEDEKQLESFLQNEETNDFLDSLTEKAMEDEESKALLKNFAAATERVEKAKQELERTNRLEQEILYVENQMARIIAEQNLADALVAEVEKDVQEAEAELRSAELALVTARAGGFTNNPANASEVEEYDKDLERIESGKAAAVSAMAGTLSSLPFLLLSGDGLGVGSLLSLGGIIASCALFGITYRYIIRRDLRNIHLKSGAAAAFALVRGIAQVDAAAHADGFPAQGADRVLTATTSATESVFIFVFATLAMDYCMREGVLSPYPLKKL